MIRVGFLRNNRSILESIIYVFIFIWSAIPPFVDLFIEVKYLTLLFLISSLLIVLFGSIPLFRRAPLVLAYFALIFILGVVHAGSPSSIINLASIAVSVFSIAVLAWYSAIRLRYEDLIHVVRKAMWGSFIVLLFGSIALTALGVPGTPEAFPWTSLFTDSRMLLVSGDVGHTNQLWLLTWVALFAMCSDSAQTRGLLWMGVLILIIAVLLLLTKTRTSFFFILILLLNFSALYLGMRNRVYASIMSLFLFAVLAIYVFFLAIPSASDYLNDFLYELQVNVPFLRLTFEGDALTGRGALNNALLDYFRQAPWFGLGNDHIIFAYGLDAYGDIAISERRKVGSESGLNVAVKYGAIFFLATLLLIVSPLMAVSINTMSREYRLSYSLVAISLLTFIFNGAFANYYGLTAVSLYLTLVFYFRGKLPKAL